MWRWHRWYAPNSKWLSWRFFGSLFTRVWEQLAVSGIRERHQPTTRCSCIQFSGTIFPFARLEPHNLFILYYATHFVVENYVSGLRWISTTSVRQSLLQNRLIGNGIQRNCSLRCCTIRPLLTWFHRFRGISLTFPEGMDEIFINIYCENLFLTRYVHGHPEATGAFKKNSNPHTRCYLYLQSLTE